MKRIRGFTLIELLVVISIIGLLIGILLPALGTARNTARQMQGSTQVRGIQQGMVIFAQGNNGRYPGLDPNGGEVPQAQISNSNQDGYFVQARFAIMLDNALFPAAYTISPSETDQTKTAWDNVGNVDNNDYSYAMLHVSGAAAGQRLTEWQDTTNAEAIVVGDRLLTGSNLNQMSSYDSVHATDGWRGSVGFNDNHVQFITLPALPGAGGNTNLSTRYGNGNLNSNNDNPFQSTANTCLLIGQGDTTTGASIMN